MRLERDVYTGDRVGLVLFLEIAGSPGEKGNYLHSVQQTPLW